MAIYLCYAPRAAVDEDGETNSMSSDAYLGMRPGDLDDKDYAGYWNPELAPLSAEAQQALLQSPLPRGYGFPVQESAQLLQAGYLPLESGYTRLASGEVFVAVKTPMPGVSGEMIDWWFGWHSNESQRYKLWHPHAHMRAVLKHPTGETPGLSDRERYVGNTSFVDEYIGDTVQELAIQFKEPGQLGLDERQFAAAGVQTAVCAEVGPAGIPINYGKLIHLIRETNDGCEMRSRFWLGKACLRDKAADHFANRLLGSRLVSKLAIPRNLGHDMVVHCAMEMTHLASFLPALYADYHPK